MRLEWSLEAMADRERIFDYIAEASPWTALDVDDRISAIDAQLRRFPSSGRVGRVPGTREFIVYNSPYIAIYELRDELVFILRVVHGARLWPPRDLI